MGDPPINSIVKIDNVWFDPTRVEYVQCKFCDQTSLRTKSDIEHAPECPHA